MTDTTKSIFNFKDLSYLRVAVDRYITQLDEIEEGSAGVSDDDFSDIQDDVEYLRRLQHMIEEQIKNIQGSGATRGTKIRLVSDRAEDDPN